jgi:hypothetical protein
MRLVAVRVALQRKCLKPGTTKCYRSKTLPSPTCNVAESRPRERPPLTPAGGRMAWWPPGFCPPRAQLSAGFMNHLRSVECHQTPRGEGGGSWADEPVDGCRGKN